MSNSLCVINFTFALFLSICATAQAKDSKNCQAVSGNFHEQNISISGNVRNYFLHVPRLKDCKKAMPVILEFHGVAPMTDIPPEELFSNEAMIEASDNTQSLLVRFRGVLRSAQATSYAWDDKIEESEIFVEKVLSFLNSKYDINTNQIFLLGFSNGTNFASHFLNKSSFQFAGLGLFSGGIFNGVSADLKNSQIKVYAVSGIADNMGKYAENTFSSLKSAGLKNEQMFFRETQGNHRISRNDLLEAIDFLFYNHKPKEVQSITGAKTLAKVDGAISAITTNTKGEIFFATSLGVMYRLPLERVIQTSPHPFLRTGFTDLCFNSKGQGIATANGRVAATNDNGKTWYPIYLEKYFNTEFIGSLFVKCQGDTFVISAEAFYFSQNLTNWQRLSDSIGFMPWAFSFGSKDQVLAFGPYDSWGLADLNQNIFQLLNPPWKNLWINDVIFVNGTWLGGGDNSRFVRASSSSIIEEKPLENLQADIYRLALSNKGTLAISGSHGLLATSDDFGKTIKTIPVQGKGAITALHWSDSKTLLVGTGNGLILELKK